MAKELLFNQKAREKILAGVTKLTDAVKVTLGARGRNVVIDNIYFAPHVTKDGVTVAKAVELPDKFENLGAFMVKEAALKTSDEAGDGTTTSTVLANAIYKGGVELLKRGYNPMEIKKGLELGMNEAIISLNLLSRPVENYEKIKQVGTISSNGDEEIGRVISEAMEATGEYGVITVEDSSTSDTSVVLSEGLQFDRGYLSKFFITDLEKNIVEYENPLIFLSDEKISNVHEFKSVFNYAITKEKRPIVIIADEFDDEIIATMAANRVNQKLPIVAVKAPGFGDRRIANIEDIATYVGCKVFNKSRGDRYDRIAPEYFGFVKKIKITMTTTTLIGKGGSDEDILKRVEIIKSQIAESTKDFDTEKLKERLARLVGGIAVIKVGALTESGLNEKKDRVEDALNATKAAVEQGVVPGGGVALLRAMDCLKNIQCETKDQRVGLNLLRESMKAPIKQILENAGKNKDKIVKIILKSEHPYTGYNVVTEQYENLVDTGVIDPTKVVTAALKNAVAVASLMLTTEAVILGIPQEFNIKE